MDRDEQMQLVAMQSLRDMADKIQRREMKITAIAITTPEGDPTLPKGAVRQCLTFEQYEWPASKLN
jgi:hypothetical protein